MREKDKTKMGGQLSEKVKAFHLHVCALAGRPQGIIK